MSIIFLVIFLCGIKLMNPTLNIWEILDKSQNIGQTQEAYVGSEVHENLL
jgi:hypothetical protein